jgi:putative NAD(P)H nitroreductase
MLNLGVYTQTEYDELLRGINNLYESRGEQFKSDEAIRNASLSAMMFMLLAKDLGWNTCPMIGFEADKVKKLYNIPENLEPVLMITMGKEDTTNIRMRGYRKPIKDYVTFETF